MTNRSGDSNGPNRYGLRALGEGSGWALAIFVSLCLAAPGVYLMATGDHWHERVVGCVLLLAAILSFVDSLDRLRLLRPNVGADEKQHRSRLAKALSGVERIYGGFRRSTGRESPFNRGVPRGRK